MLVLILATIFAILFYYVCIKPLNYWKERGVAQGNTVPLFGNSWKTVIRQQGLAGLTQEMYNLAPGSRYSGMYQMTKPFLIVKDPELIKKITVKDFDHFTDHRLFIDAEADPLWGRNLLSLRGQVWKDMRATLSPSFTGSKMRSMFDLMLEASENFIEYFKEMKNEIVETELKDSFTRYANDVIASTAFGLEVDSLKNPDNQFYLMGKEITTFGNGIVSNLKILGHTFLPKLSKLLGIKFFSHRARTFFVDLINDTMKYREENNVVRPDMLQLLIEAKNNANNDQEPSYKNGARSMENGRVGNSHAVPITTVDITAQALIFFFAGFDTVSTLMCFVAYELAVHPDIQTRLRKEVNNTSEECGGKINYDALQKMKYLDMVISETLRKWPPFVAIDRVCTKPYNIEPVQPEEKPIHLMKGDVVWLPIIGIGNDTNHFPNPEVFDPERFSDENKGNINPYTFLTFGMGPRVCIGARFALLEAKLVIFQIVSNFEIVPTERTQIPFKIAQRGFNLQSENGFWLGLKRLNKV